MTTVEFHFLESGFPLLFETGAKNLVNRTRCLGSESLQVLFERVNLTLQAL
jgi:hypothetical protein